MSQSPIDYRALLEDAARGVVREVLQTVARDGLPGDHHFLITFLTPAEGVRLADELRHRHPQRMTIVLQHRFWDLEADEHGFAVTLSFDGRRHRIGVPWPAVVGFGDPSVGLVLQFGESGDDEVEDPAAEPKPQHADGPPTEEILLDGLTEGEDARDDDEDNVVPFRRREED